MSRLAVKLTASVVAAGLAAAVVYPVYTSLTAQPEVAFKKRGAGARAAAAGPPPPADVFPTAASEEGLPGVLEVENGRFPPSAFRREPIPVELARDMWDLASPWVQYDPHVYYRHRAHLRLARDWPEHPDGEWFLVTNGMGLREDVEVAEEPPDLRILIAGDSHTDGVCNNDEAFGNLLEESLATDYPSRRIESLNGGKGGYSFYRYLGTLERFLPLRPDVFVLTVYGGNDFEEGLQLYHHFNGTDRPPGSKLYWDEIEAAMEINKPCLAQAFLSFKYFDVHPGQMEAALQMARDATTEIQATCLRNDVHLVVVYVPPLSDVEWNRHAETLEAVTEALELSPAGLHTTERMADSYIDFLRERRIDVVDMRPAYRESAETNYWEKDHHINLAGQARIAEMLRPVVDGTGRLTRPRTRRDPGAAGLGWREAASRLYSPGAPDVIEDPTAKPSRRRTSGGARVRETAVRKIFRVGPDHVFDPDVYFTYRPGLIEERTSGDGSETWLLRTNPQGLREDRAIDPEGPDVRILLAGDDQLAGACPNAGAAGNVLEIALARRHEDVELEVVNTATDGYTFHNYLAVLRSWLDLEPDVFVLGISSGDDFLEAVRPMHFFGGTRMPRKNKGKKDGADPAAELVAEHPGPYARYYESLEFFQNSPRQAKLVLREALDVTYEIESLCIENDIRLVVVRIPPAPWIEPEEHRDLDAEMVEALGLETSDLQRGYDLAQIYFDRLRVRGLQIVDLEGVFSRLADRGPFYLKDDYRLRPDSQRLIAAQLLPVMESYLFDAR